jgi:Concanavalin A-like lectin/glucanases superfamily
VSVTGASVVNNFNNQPFTMSAWINASSYGSGMNFMGDQSTWQVCGTWLGVGQLGDGKGAEIYTNVSGGYFDAAYSPISLNQWVHIVGVFTGAQIVLYVNGAQATSTAISQAPSCASPTFYIGKAVQGGWGNYVGLIDDVRVYNRALSGAEVQALYNAER